MADGLSTARRAIEARLHQLDEESQRLDEESARLREALAKLEPNGGAPTRTRSRASSNSRRRSSRRAPRGERQRQFLAALEKHPGAKPPQIAKDMGVPPSHVYTLARRLQESGRIKKRRGGGYALKS